MPRGVRAKPKVEEPAVVETPEFVGFAISPNGNKYALTKDGVLYDIFMHPTEHKYYYRKLNGGFDAL